MAHGGARIQRPSALLLALEARGLASPARLLAAAPFLMSAPRGGPQAVIVLPGLGASDRSTSALRFYLRFLGYQPHGWNRGRNVRPAGADLPAVAAQIGALRAATGIPVTLVGWSRGGLIAREAARIAPDAVRMVITLGSPFAAPAATNVGAAWRRLTGEGLPAQGAEYWQGLAAPLPVPSTSIYSRADGIVAWRACLQPDGLQSESIEVQGSHLGLGFNPAALWVIADRLAQPLGTWTPFRPSGLAAPFFPRRRNAPNSRRGPS
ncbi:lipase family alpha/beta hydrolase [Roseiarcus sp.]|uniref:lipase family alpha/beta hydrolase n=1 Tax=Roseiarcus sp. TaxID=1969460 RepID=UPI003F9B58F0